MLPLDKIRPPLAGLWLLAKGDARGLSVFDITDDGVIHSFRAVLYCLPALLLYAILKRIDYLHLQPDLNRSHAVFLFQVMAVEAATWCVTLLSILLFGMLFGLRPLLRPLVVMVNWGAIPITYISYGIVLPLLLLLQGGSTSVWFLQTGLLLGAIIILLVLTWRILHTVVGGTKWRRAAFVFLVALLPLLIVRSLETSMRLNIPHG